MADVFLTPQAQREFDSLPAVIKERLRHLFLRLERWPAFSGVKALTGNLAGLYRMRTGDYRLRFYVRGDAVFVDRIGHRKDFYD